jgi:hypothetical protein
MSTSLKGYFESNTFIGGQTVTPISGSDFAATERRRVFARCAP